MTVLARHAYRRPVTAADMTPLMKMYAQGRKGSDFEHGIEAAVEAVLVSPDFLFMRESDPAKSAAGDVHKHQRCGTGDEAVLLPVEQHPRR